MPSPPFRHGFTNDVFVSYAHADNEPDPAGRRWVFAFAEDLHRRLAQVSGRSVRVWRDDRLGAADVLDREIGDQLARSAVLVPVVSPNYLNSRPCAEERQAFVDAAARTGGLIVGNKARIVKVVKYPELRQNYPPEFQDLLEHKFYVELPNGQPREFLLHEDAAVRARYLPRVDDVAFEIAQILRMLEAGTDLPASKGAVFLAETTSDLDDTRDRLRRALEQRGYEVLPSRALPTHAAKLFDVVTADLQRSKLSIHPVGAHLGLVPEQASGRSIVQLQLECAALALNGGRGDARPGERLRRPDGSGGPGRLIWIPEGLVAADAAQQTFLEAVRRDYPGLGFEVIESTLQKLETHVRDRLEPAAPVLPARDGDDDRLRVYLMCDLRDREAARVVRRGLLARGFEVDFPPESGEPAEVRELHYERLREDEAFVIYYGESPDLWVQRQLGDLRKAAGLGRRAPVAARRVFLANPKTSDKEDLLADADLVLNGLPPTTPEEALQPLVNELTLAAGRRTAGSGQGAGS